MNEMIHNQNNSKVNNAEISNVVENSFNKNQLLNICFQSITSLMKYFQIWTNHIFNIANFSINEKGNIV